MGYTTLDDGATSEADCVIKPGWTDDGLGGVAKCKVGTYKEAFGPGTCQPCPSGTTTVLPGGISPINCDICRPGYGATGGGGGTAPLVCELCTPGSWSSGGGALACLSCGTDRTSRPVGTCHLHANLTRLAVCPALSCVAACLLIST